MTDTEQTTQQAPAPEGTEPRPAGGVLVAVDGSEPADHALEWAAAEARLRSAPLTVVHCYYWPSTGLGAMDAIGFLMDGLEQDSREVLEAAGARARELAPDIKIHTVSHLGAPLAALVDMSGDYELVVLGSRGLGGFKGMLLGSVSTGVVAHAHGPVVIVRGDEVDPAAPVLVGVDASAESAAALAEGFAAAQRRGCGVVAVHAWEPPQRPIAADQEEAWQRSIAEDLEIKVAEVAAKFPGVPVESVTFRDRPVAALLSRAQTAQLVVVGTRGRGELKGMLLGSTSRAMVQHAPCPVLVVR